jgi:hypothetical protein
MFEVVGDPVGQAMSAPAERVDLGIWGFSDAVIIDRARADRSPNHQITKRRHPNREP